LERTICGTLFPPDVEEGGILTVSIELTAGQDRVSIDPEDGARLTSLVAGGAERLLTAPPEGAAPELVDFLWGCYLMVPWVGRLKDNEIRWGDETHIFPANFGSQSIHGLVRDEAWKVDSSGDSTASMSCTLGNDRWPWGGSFRYEIDLAPGSLTLVLQAEAADRSMPLSMGWHPWFRRLGDTALKVDSDQVLELDDDLIPTGNRRPVDDVTDLRTGPALGERLLDHVYVSSRPPAVITWPDLSMAIEWSAPADTLVIHTPPAGFCVEPQTAWPNAPALAQAGIEGTGLAVVEPGQTAALTTTWIW